MNSPSQQNPDAPAITPEHSLDLTGLKCPLPVLKARRQINSMAAGEILQVMADDPAAPLDFDHFCHTNGHQLVETQTAGTVFTFIIRAGAGGD